MKRRDIFKQNTIFFLHFFDFLCISEEESGEEDESSEEETPDTMPVPVGSENTISCRQNNLKTVKNP